jgi:uncharacterized Fe-S radical SAM superfamily protein PflX
MKPFFPAYFNLSTADIEKRAQAAHSHLEKCDACARNCGVNRLLEMGDQGICKTELRVRISSYGVEMGMKLRSLERKAPERYFCRLPMKFKFYQPYEIGDFGRWD